MKWKIVWLKKMLAYLGEYLFRDHLKTMCSGNLRKVSEDICVITFNLRFSTYMLLEWRFMLYFNVIILVPCPSHLLKFSYCLAVWKNVHNSHNGRTWFLYDLLWETTCLERPLLLGRRGGRPRPVLLYHQWLWSKGKTHNCENLQKCVLKCCL